VDTDVVADPPRRNDENDADDDGQLHPRGAEPRWAGLAVNEQLHPQRPEEQPAGDAEGNVSFLTHATRLIAHSVRFLSRQIGCRRHAAIAIAADAVLMVGRAPLLMIAALALAAAGWSAVRAGGSVTGSDAGATVGRTGASAAVSAA
jgi:hypothetical protein